MKDYANVDWSVSSDQVVSELVSKYGLIPIAIERRQAAEPLDTFPHPERALYIFGPEDGSISPGVLRVCHRFVVIPTVHPVPLNLAAAVNVVLYDRLAKERANGI
jgi:tRNA(Leu) C34 or U34 (ribose-2'-O)-methylase TrmL